MKKIFKLFALLPAFLLLTSGLFHAGMHEAEEHFLPHAALRCAFGGGANRHWHKNAAPVAAAHSGEAVCPYCAGLLSFAAAGTAEAPFFSPAAAPRFARGTVWCAAQQNSQKNPRAPPRV